MRLFNTLSQQLEELRPRGDAVTLYVCGVTPYDTTHLGHASINVVYAQLYLDVGPENVTHTAHQMGITSELHSYPAEAIGGLTYGVTPLEMADAYATLAAGGIHSDPQAIKRVVFPDGKVDDLGKPKQKRVLPQWVAVDTRNTAGDQPASETHLDHGDQGGIFLEGDARPAQIIRLHHGGAPSV